MTRLRRTTIPIVMFLVIRVAAFAAPSKEYFQHYQAASIAERSGNWKGALDAWQRLQRLTPESPGPYFAAAKCAARLNQPDEAFRWLEKAVTAQYEWPDQARNSDDLVSLHDDARWQPTLDRMQSLRDERDALWRQPRAFADADSAPVFKSWKKLVKAFEPRITSLEDSQWRMPPLDFTRALLTYSDDRVAAAHRYLADHPSARDREDALWDIVATLKRVRKPEEFVWAPLGPAARQIVDVTDAYLSAYPSGAHRAEAKTIRAFAVFGDRPDTKLRAWSADDLAALRASLQGVAKEFEGTTAGGLALANDLVLADMTCVGAVTPDMLEMRSKLDALYAHDAKVQEFLTFEGRGALLRMQGVREFEGTDLSGRMWDAVAFEGKVTLIDFWATWCGPCVGEIPSLKKAWNELHDKGFQIVGVSLDTDDRKSFETWLQSNGVTWPQIWDGKGWTTPLARKFGVRAIPTPILVDASGRVDSASLRGDELVARIRELLRQD